MKLFKRSKRRWIGKASTYDLVVLRETFQIADDEAHILEGEDDVNDLYDEIVEELDRRYDLDVFT